MQGEVISDLAYLEAFDQIIGLDLEISALTDAGSRPLRKRDRGHFPSGSGKHGTVQPRSRRAPMRLPICSGLKQP